ncbi:MAG: hypothetical protein R3B90_12375 [Planctomycetaceae bacterium]
MIGHIDVAAETINVNANVDLDTTGGDTDGNVTFSDATTITMNDTSTIAAGTGDVTMTASGDILLSRILNANLVSITSSAGSIDDNRTTDEAANITAVSIALRAASGIGSDASATDDIDTSGAGGGTLNLAAETDSGDIAIRNIGNLLITSVDGLNGVQLIDTADNNSGADHVSVIATGSLSVVQTVVNNDGGQIVLASQGTTAANDLSINADITATGGNGNVSLYAGHDISLLGTTFVSAAGNGAVLAAAGENFNDGTPAAGHADADVTMADGTEFVSVNGAVTIRATTNVTLSRALTSGTVTVTADSNQFGLADNDGAILDGTAGELANIIAGTAILSAATGIGSGVAGDANDIDIALGTLDAVNSTSGDINFDEAGVITVNRIDQNANTGRVTLVADGTITIAAGQSGVEAVSGSVALTANGLLADIAINHTITTQGTSAASGNVTINAGRNVTSAAAGTITTSATALNAASGAVDIDAGGFVFLLGDVVTTGGNGDANGGRVDIDTVDGAITVNNITAGALGAGIAGDINLHANDAAAPADSNITINSVLTTSNGGTVRLDAAGSIIDGSGSSATDIVATNVLLRAASGVGANVNQITTQAAVGSASLILAAETSTGGIFVLNNGCCDCGHSLRRDFVNHRPVGPDLHHQRGCETRGPERHDHRQ